MEKEVKKVVEAMSDYATAEKARLMIIQQSITEQLKKNNAMKMQSYKVV